jgi:hypothetical protein
MSAELVGKQATKRIVEIVAIKETQLIIDFREWAFEVMDTAFRITD